jgi:hypothetical protein
VRVPEEVGDGNVRVTLSFADWKEGRVAPATYEVPIAVPEKAETAEKK